MERAGKGKKMLRVIGIDFGTSSTYMNIKRYDLDNPAKDSFNYIPVAFEHGESKGSLISVIRENSDGTFDFGRIANEETEGSVIHRNFKMDLESSDRERRRKAGKEPEPCARSVQISEKRVRAAAQPARR